MTECVDYLIVGSGLTGATIARMLADAGRQVLVLERRSHVGGNVHDHVHSSGIPVHTYGPHYFRTRSLRIWNHVRRFDSFFPFQAQLKTLVDGAVEDFPPSPCYIERVTGAGWHAEFQGTPRNFQEACLARMPRVVYDKFIKGYTEKQWGVAAESLSVSLARRIEIRRDVDPRLSQHRYQGLPTHGYAEWMRKMLAGISLRVSTDYLEQRDQFCARKCLIFTGPIDEYFGFDFGRLEYRAQKRVHTYLPHVRFAQPTVQLNNPGPESGAHIRTIEWKHMMPSERAGTVRGTVLTTETPYTPSDSNCYEYPFPDAQNAELYKHYRHCADRIPNLLICGRLGEYRYYDMDQAIGRAMLLAQRLLAEAI